MRQMRWLFWVLAVLFLVVACGGSEEPETAVANPTAETLPDPPTPEPATLTPPPPPVVVVEDEGEKSDEDTAVDPEPEVVEEKIRPWPADRFWLRRTNSRQRHRWRSGFHHGHCK